MISKANQTAFPSGLYFVDSSALVLGYVDPDSDRISVLVFGRVIACGAPEAIQADPEVRRAYLGDE